MIPLPFAKDRAFAVLGLGKSGLVAAEALSASGAVVRAWDDEAGKREAARAKGIALVDLAGDGIEGAAALVLSPGIPHTRPAPHPVAARAKALGVPIIGDVELLLGGCAEARLVAITGTNGKSTTTALIGHVLAEAGREVEVGGNLGTPALSFRPFGAAGTYVLELSSYQLELTPSLAPDVAVLLNITPDHLDRHGGMAGYVAAKARIFARARAGGVAVIGIDDDACRGIAGMLRAVGRRVIAISVREPVPGGVYLDGTTLIDDIDGTARAALDLVECPALPGSHNAQNAAAAYAAARSFGVEPGVIARAIRSFAGLAHRQERVADIEGVIFVNDSKATNADATERALVCYENIYWIAGGVPKAGGIAPLAPYFPRIRRAYLIGQAADAFAATLGAAVAHQHCGDLKGAVQAIIADLARDRPAHAVVLLSPACASFDQYSGFEARGGHFRELVAAHATEIAEVLR